MTAELGPTLTALIERLFPICRSITGDGVRETLGILSEHIDLTIHEVPSGTKVLDWTVPPEWNISDAYVADLDGNRVIDFRESNLHVVSYSTPVNQRMTLDELRPHLHSLPDQPSLVPYRTSYYEQTWGFCVADDVLQSLPDIEYEVVIDSSLAPGSLTYGELVIPGQTDEEVIISTHVCHPSLGDDNLSGIAVSVLLAKQLAADPPSRRTHRFIYAPGTIGTIAWLHQNKDQVAQIAAGLTLTCLGDSATFTYKRTEQADAAIDRATEYVLAHADLDHDVIDFFPYGYDERQYNSPGFRAPVGSLMRGRHGQFPEYHTSADNLAFVDEAQLVEAFNVVGTVLDVLEGDRTMLNVEPFGEPQLGSRGLYAALGGSTIADAQLAMLWVLNQSDGATSLLDIATRSGIAFTSIAETAAVLESHGLLTET